ARQSRLRLTTAYVVEGRVREFAGGAVRFRTGDTIVASRIRQVEIGVHERSGAIPGALIGAAILGPAISYFLLDSSRAGSGIEISGVSLEALAAGGVLGALA